MQVSEWVGYVINAPLQLEALILVKEKHVKAGQLDDEAAQKIRAMSQSDLPIEDRRSWYNAMARKMRSGVGLKAGLVEKYNAACSSRKERFNLLKEFMIDPNMRKA